MEVVKGSGRGIGAETLLTFARGGANVVVNDLSEAEAAGVAKQAEALGVQAMVSTHDVSALSAAQELVAKAKEKFGRVDILVNNAGITRDGMLHKLTEQQWDDVIRVNLKGPFNMTQSCVKLMIEQKYGKIVNLASIAWLGNIGQTNYAASKAGVVGMTRTWALELARHNITVNAVAPGLIDTQMTQAIPAEVKEKFIAKIPMKRMGKVQDIAELITFLASDAAGYVTGQTIQIDGGLTTGASG